MPDGILCVLQLTLGVALNCERKEEIIEQITETDNFDENTMGELMRITQLVLAKYVPESGMQLDESINPNEVSADTQFEIVNERNRLRVQVEQTEEENKRLREAQKQLVEQIEKQEAVVQDKQLEVESLQASLKLSVSS